MFSLRLVPLLLLGGCASTSGPINAILLDHAHGTIWGGSSNFGEDYGIAW